MLTIKRYLLPLMLKTVKLPTASAVGKTDCTSIKFDQLALLATLYQLSKGLLQSLWLRVYSLKRRWLMRVKLIG